MEHLRLTSVRLDPETLRKIDAVAEAHYYLTRSSIINAILTNVVNCSDEDTLWRIIRTYAPHTCGYMINFRVDKERLANLPHDD